MLRDRRPRGDHGRQVIGESAGKVEGLRFRRAVVLVEQGGRTGPADLDAPEQIRLGARHPVEPRRLEAGILAEDLRVGVEAQIGSASCRERVCQYVLISGVAGSLKNTKQ